MPLEGSAMIPTSLLFQAVDLWKKGCTALTKDSPEKAYPYFEKAAQLFPQGKIYKFSEVLALAQLKRWQEVDELLRLIRLDWRDDSRYDVLSAIVGASRENLDEAELILQKPADDLLDAKGNELLRRWWSGTINDETLNELKNEFPKAWRDYNRKKSDFRRVLLCSSME